MEVKLQQLTDELLKKVDYAIADDFYKKAKRIVGKDDNIDFNNAEFQLFLRDFMEMYESDYQYQDIKKVLEKYYNKEYDIKKESEDNMNKDNIIKDIKACTSQEQLEDVLINISSENLSDLLLENLYDLKSEMDDNDGNFNYMNTYIENLCNVVEDYFDDSEEYEAELNESKQNKKIESINFDGFSNDKELQKYFQNLGDLPDEVEIDGIKYKMEQYGGSGDNAYVIYTDINNEDSYIKVFYSLNKTEKDNYKGIKEIKGVSDLRENKKITESNKEDIEDDLANIEEFLNNTDGYATLEAEAILQKLKDKFDQLTKKYTKKEESITNDINIQNDIVHQLEEMGMDESQAIKTYKALLNIFINSMENKKEAKYLESDNLIELVKNLDIQKVSDIFNRMKKDGWDGDIEKIKDYFDKALVKVEESKKLNESTSIISKEEFINDLVNDFDNIDTSDLQGIVSARCMQTGEDEEEILNAIYEKVKKPDVFKDMGLSDKSMDEILDNTFSIKKEEVDNMQLNNKEFSEKSLYYWTEIFGVNPIEVDYEENEEALNIINKFKNANKLEALFDYLSSGVIESFDSEEEYLDYVADTDISDFEIYNGKLEENKTKKLQEAENIIEDETKNVESEKEQAEEIPEEQAEEIEEDTTILDLLQDRIGQDLSVGEFNTILQGIFGKYNEVYLLTSDLYNMDSDELQEVVIFDEEDMYTITFEIKDLYKAIIEITDVDIQ